MGAKRIRVGVSHWPDGWNVVVEADGQKRVYDPTFKTEAEAAAKADETAALLRKTMADADVQITVGAS